MTRVDWSVRYPRPLLDKLGVKEGARVSLIAVPDPGFAKRLAERTEDVSTRPRKDTDLIFYGVENLKALDRLDALRPNLTPAGAIWVLRVKGDDAVVKETEVIDAAKRQGLVDIKVVSFSDTHSALKLVIPLHLR